MTQLLTLKLPHNIGQLVEAKHQPAAFLELDLEILVAPYMSPHTADVTLTIEDIDQMIAALQQMKSVLIDKG